MTTLTSLAKVAAAAIQSAVYVLAMRDLVGDTAAVHHESVLICPRDFANTPLATTLDVRKQLGVLERQLSRIAGIDSVLAHVPADVSFSLDADEKGVPQRDPGDLLPPGRPNSLKLVNLYRFLTGMPEVTEDPTFDTDAQDCAIIQAANGLSHTPATTDTCYNATGAAASNRSSISSGQSVAL